MTFSSVLPVEQGLIDMRAVADIRFADGDTRLDEISGDIRYKSKSFIMKTSSFLHGYSHATPANSSNIRCFGPLEAYWD